MTQRGAPHGAKRRRAWLAVCVAMLLAACARAVLMPPANEDAGAAIALRRMSTASERMVVVVVANAEASTRARGTEAFGDRADRAAQAAVAALENDYRLREVMEWPIVALQSHCVVLEIEGTQSRDEVLAKLSKDARVRLAQPLLTFRPSGARNDSGARPRPGTQAIPVPSPFGIGVKDFLTDKSAGSYLVAGGESTHIGAELPRIF